MIYSLSRTAKIFVEPHQVNEVLARLKNEIASQRLPALDSESGRKGWHEGHIGEVGAKFGFLAPLKSPKVVSVFITKGGVLKSSLTLNLARMAALHNIRTLVIGLDLQGDITSALGHGTLPESGALEDAFATLEATRGLADYFLGDCGLTDVIVPTSLKNLDLLPETPELTSIDQQLLSRSRREYWLKEKVTEPLKNKYDLILLDCSPNWNQLITNALVAADVLVSPVECKIHNYRNLRLFQILLQQFRTDLMVSLKQVYVPTRLSPQRRLSKEIFAWYQNNLENCLPISIRESVQGEEASALHLSVPEYAPGSAPAEEMKSVIQYLWHHINQSPLKYRTEEVSSWPSV